MKRWMMVAGTLSLGLIASSTHADVVGPEPSSCPNGGTPRSCHAGPYCGAESCGGGSDAACPAGTVCRDVSVCVSSVVCAGLVAPGEDLEQYRRETVEGACAGNCATGTCMDKRICVPAQGTSGSTGSGGSGSGARGGSGGSASSGTGGSSPPLPSVAESDGCSCRIGRSAQTRASVLLFGCALLALALRVRTRAALRSARR